MKDLLDRLAGLLPGDMGEKGIKFLVVSAFNVVFGQSLLFLGQTVLDLAPTAANVMAVSISAVPAYILSRYWVWQKNSKNLFWREVFPFWALAFLGLLVSTLAVWVVEENVEDVAPLVVNATNLSAFGLIWVAKFFILDRILFVHVNDEADPAEMAVEN